MSPKDAAEKHFWELLIGLEKDLFIKFADIDETEYNRFRAYLNGERKSRPRNKAAILKLRMDILHRLDAHEVTHELGLIV